MLRSGIRYLCNLYLVLTDLFVVVEVSPSDVVVVVFAALVLLVALLHPRTRIAPRRLKRQLRRNLGNSGVICLVSAEFPGIYLGKLPKTQPPRSLKVWLSQQRVAMGAAAASVALWLWLGWRWSSRHSPPPPSSHSSAGWSGGRSRAAPSCGRSRAGPARHYFRRLKGTLKLSDRMSLG